MEDEVKVEVVRKQDTVEEARAHGEEVMEAFKDFEIEDADDFEVAAECLKEIKAQAKKLKAEKELATKPMNSALRQVRSWFRPAEDALSATEAYLKKKIADWTLLQEERSRQAMEAAAAASQAGNFDAAHEAAKGIVERPRAQGVSVSMPGWDYILEDVDKVPREYLALDHSKVRIYLKAAGSEEPDPIPGLRFVRGEATVTARTK